MCIHWKDRSDTRTDRVALHFCDVTLTAKKPQNKAYPKTPVSIDDHIRMRQLHLKLFQKDVAPGFRSEYPDRLSLGKQPDESEAVPTAQNLRLPGALSVAM